MPIWCTPHYTNSAFMPGPGRGRAAGGGRTWETRGRRGRAAGGGRTWEAGGAAHVSR